MERKELQKEYGRLWSTDELTSDFRVLSFQAPFVIVEDKKFGVKGTLMFQPMPRFYFQWQAYEDCTCDTETAAGLASRLCPVCQANAKYGSSEELPY